MIYAAVALAILAVVNLFFYVVALRSAVLLWVGSMGLLVAGIVLVPEILRAVSRRRR